MRFSLGLLGLALAAACGQQRPGEISAIVLAPDGAAAEVSFTFTITTKSGDRVPGQGVATALLRKRAGGWKIVHWHESEEHFDAVMGHVFGAHR